jgi:hypothetical protein
MLDADGNEIVDDSTNEIDTSTEKPVMADTGIPQDVADVIRGVRDDLKEEEVLEEETTDGDTDGDIDDSVETDDDTEVTDDDADDFAILGYDAETIEKLREINPDILKDIKGLISASEIDDEASEEVVDDDTTLDSTEQVADGGLTEEQLTEIAKDNPQMAAVIKTLNAQVGLLTNSLNTVAEAEQTRNQEAVQRQHVANFRSANKKLDEISEDFPILGTYDKLPQRDNKPDMRNPAVKQRAGIWDYATKLHDGGVTVTFDDALDDAIALYQAKNADNLAMRKVSSELRGRAKKITNRPTSKKTKKKEHTPGTEAFKISVVKDAFKKAGVTT